MKELTIFNWLQSYGLAVIVFLAIDMIWLTIIAKGLYQRALAELLAPKFLLAPAMVFYLIFLFGLIFFAVMPALTAGLSWQETALRAALFGFCCYATYNLTNWSVLKNWPGWLTYIDLAWGSFISAATATITVLILRRFQ